MILEAMYNGEFYPCETVVPTSPEYRKAAEERKIDEESRLSRKKLFGRFQHSPVDLFTLL